MADLKNAPPEAVPPKKRKWIITGADPTAKYPALRITSADALSADDRKAKELADQPTGSKDVTMSDGNKPKAVAEAR